MGDPMALAGMVAVFAGIFTISLMLINGLGERAGITRTLNAAGEGYRVGPATPGAGAVRGGTLGMVRQRLAGLARRLTSAGGREKLGARLDQAGNPASLTVASVMEYKGQLAACGCGLGLLIGMAVAGPAGIVLWTLGGVAVGFYAPNLLIAHLAQERQQQIRRTLPDILDTLVITVEAGLGFEAAMAHVVRSGRGPMVGEFARALHEMQLGQPRVDAVRQLGIRTTVTELKAFSSAVVHATTLGVPLGGVLRQQSNEMRLRRRQRAEELAQKVPVKILFPMILCIFPALFVVVIGPGVINAFRAIGG